MWTYDKIFNSNFANLNINLIILIKFISWNIKEIMDLKNYPLIMLNNYKQMIIFTQPKLKLLITKILFIHK